MHHFYLVPIIYIVGFSTTSCLKHNRYVRNKDFDSFPQKKGDDIANEEIKMFVENWKELE